MPDGTAEPQDHAAIQGAFPDQSETAHACDAPVDKPLNSAVAPKSSVGEDGDAGSDEEDEDPAASGFDFAALEEAQRLASAGGEALVAGLKRKRGGCKETRKRRKRQRRDDDVLKAVKAGLIPRLRDALCEAAAQSSRPPAKSKAASAGQQSATSEKAAAPPSGSSANAATAGEPASAPPTKAQLRRAILSYADVEEDDQADGSERRSKEQTSLARRVIKDIQRRQKVAKVADAKTVFVKNISFDTTEDDLRKMLGQHGVVESTRMARDKFTTKVLGYAHTTFETAAQAQNAINKCHKTELKGRILYVSSAEPGKKCDFELPAEVRDSIVELIRERCEGKNLSVIRDTWQKRHPGQQLVLKKWGFKFFHRGLQSIDSIVLERHPQKKLTLLPFIQGSEAHQAFLKQRSEHEAEELGKADATAQESKGAKEEGSTHDAQAGSESSQLKDDATK